MQQGSEPVGIPLQEAGCRSRRDLFESNGKGLNSLMWNRFKSLCWNVCTAVGCHLGAGWTGLLFCYNKTVLCVLAQERGCAEHPRCVQRNGMPRGTETWSLPWSCVKESCGRGMEGLSWPESSWFFPSREIGAGCEGREGEQCLLLKQSPSQKMAATQPPGFYFFNIYQAL